MVNLCLLIGDTIAINPELTDLKWLDPLQGSVHTHFYQSIVHLKVLLKESPDGHQSCP
jgi:hypothetical protein